ncbi:MAG: L,D-transpeptidase family protein [Anaerolineales bacterium]
MNASFSRRDFLKLSALTLGGLAFRPSLPEEDRVTSLGLGRVTATRLNIRNEPSFSSERIGWRPKDHIFQLWDEIISPDGPVHNPRWYRIAGGYIHSGYVQRVKTLLNRPLTSIRPTRQLVEVTVPFTQSWQRVDDNRWRRLYRLYYGSMHWVTGIHEGADGQAWYEITDDLLKIPYSVPTAHLRPILDSELTPISPRVPELAKRIDVSLTQQTVTAYEFNRPVFRARVSTGIPQEDDPGDEIPTDTPIGKHIIDHKRPVRHMGDGEVTSDPYAYELPGVPWVSYFYSHTGVAFHGTYWHDNFGKPMSHGCVNMRNEDAKWLFRWTMPGYDATKWERLGRGTLVHVF